MLALISWKSYWITRLDVARGAENIICGYSIIVGGDRQPARVGLSSVLADFQVQPCLETMLKVGDLRVW